MKIQKEIIGAAVGILLLRFGGDLIGWQPFNDIRDVNYAMIGISFIILARGLDEVIVLMRQINNKLR